MGRWIRRLAILGIAFGLIVWTSTRWLLPAMGRFLVDDRPPTHADAVVVLATGLEYYPRLIEAARLVTEGYASRIIIDGNRKIPALRRLEAKGFKPVAPWYENHLRVLELLGVPRERVVTISAEDAYDTVSESRAVAAELPPLGIHHILLVTSRFHTRRAGTIWQDLHGDQLRVTPVAAREDPFDPKGWWHQGRQIRWVMAEYGGWLFYAWQRLMGKDAQVPPAPTPQPAD